MLITVFTPTYNRAHLLPKVYKSLLSQTYNNFEWIIVDDGSTDNTGGVVNDFIAEQKINITYCPQPNKGKHFAINRGVSIAKGELFVILDSDDFLPTQALKIINDQYLEVQNREGIGGVVGRKAFYNGDVVGNGLKDSVLANPISIRYKHFIKGDLAEVFKTSVLKEFPFPEIENEKFCPEVLVWNRIATKYELLYFNDVVYHCEYLDDGLTSKIVKIRMTSPVASILTYSELESYKIPLVQKIKANINFWRFSFNSNWSFFKKLSRVSPIFSVVGVPLGYIMYLKDKKTYT